MTATQTRRAGTDADTRRPHRRCPGPDHPHRGRLGIYTKIDFGTTPGGRVPLHVVDLPRVLDLHEGQGPAGRALHHQPHLRASAGDNHGDLLGLQPEHGLRGAPAAPGGVDHQPGRGRRVHVRPQHLPGEPGRGGLLREDDLGDQPRGAGAGQPHRVARTRRPRVPDHRRHHAGAQPVHRRVLPGGAAGQPVHPGDVLPDGGAPRAPVRRSTRAAVGTSRPSSCSPTTTPGSCATWSS
jgi:hypothetical protein